ncbi:MAG: ribonuclease PH [Actinomycetota bacterium]|nr:ribonuclease PH [Euzebyaceae bacterium]MDQ3452090.1 ribonuclease PH [Actinomycetota bacterium]
MTRSDGRSNDALRPVSVRTGVQEFAEGSALVSFGRTQVLCAASLDTGVPRWRQGSGLGWVTAEYSMLPRATSERTARESTRGRVGGRTHEIQRLIGRSLRAAVDLADLREHTIQVDCDVLQADGGTRTAAITGAWVALALAIDEMVRRGLRPSRPTMTPLAAVSVGVVAGEPMLDLCYAEDVVADTDCNVVMTGDGRFVEVQSTAEHDPFSRAQLDRMLELATDGCRALFKVQQAAVEGA